MPKEYALLYPQPDASFMAVRGHPFYSILKEAREKAGIGVRELARSAGCSHSHLMLIENGARTPAPKLLSKLQKSLGLEPFFLVPREELESGALQGLRIDIPPGDDNEHGLELLVGVLLSALRRGGFDPGLGVPGEAEKSSGTVSKIHLGTNQKFEVQIKAVQK